MERRGLRVRATVRKRSASMTYEGQAGAAEEQSMSESQSREFRAETSHQDLQLSRSRAAQQRWQQAQTTKRQVTQKLDLASPKKEMASNTFSNDSRSVPPRGSLLLQHCDTKRSVAAQTADSVEHEDSLWDWVTTSTTTTAAPQTSAQEALQQWCSIQREYRVFLWLGPFPTHDQTFGIGPRVNMCLFGGVWDRT